MSCVTPVKISSTGMRVSSCSSAMARMIARNYGADDREELVEEGAEALLVADGQHIGLHEEERGARSLELLDKFAVIRFKLFGGDDLA